MFVLLLLLLSFSCKKNVSVSTPEVNIDNVDVVMTNKDPEIDSSGTIITRKVSATTTVEERKMEGVPTICTGKDGKLYAAWYASNIRAGEGSGDYITLAVSLDKGLTWKNNALLVEPKDKLDRIFDPSLWSDFKGNVHLSWSKCKGQWWDGVAGVWDALISSESDSIAVSVPHLLINKGIIMNKPTLLADGNTILYPNYIWNVNQSLVDNTGGIYIYRQNVSSAQKPTFVSRIPLPDWKVLVAEPQILQLNGDTLATYIRTPTGIFSTTSFNGGMSWTPSTQLKTIGDNPDSRFFIGRLKSNNILLVVNSAVIRTRLTAFISVDNGKTFKYKLLLDGRDPVSYPDVTEDNEGNIYVIYDRERTKAKEILVVKIKESDIVNNTKIPTPQKINL